MPPLTSTSTARACPTDEQLRLARDHEYREMQRYRGLALSFLPTRPRVSRLMAAIGVECEQRLAALAALADHLQLRHCLPVEPPRRFRLPEAHRLHLFIANDAMACQALGYALAAAHHSRQFSELLVRFCHTAELEALLEHFIEQKRNECRLLEETQDSAYAISAWA
ncbi:hypothetical protein [Halomonas kalidii]|uniref:DUF892 family protein n=1 Tax=Halomonas kalidii TaxID=3043293 RepID=A0ABT6VKF1_9GAMM|nr:hypothetical protein [Halomonas kalidii]MDI5934452.1 hypothetical protein [Halomonas kalidii]